MLDINEKVTAICGLLSLQGVIHDGCFYQEDNNMELHPIPWVIDGRINMELVEYAADILGVTTNDLLEMRGDRIDRWRKKYALVKYWGEMRKSVNKSYLRKPTSEERLYAAVYGLGKGHKYVTRYNLMELEDRVMAILMEQEAESPGMIHPGERIECFVADTVYICHYRHITEMLDSFFAMVRRGKDLFFKALKHDLTEEEICEYNLIVSYTGIRDKHYISQGLYYRYLVMFRPLYLAEKGKDFFDYIVLNKNIPFQPWRFAEIIVDQARMERYLSYVPRAKMLMRIFAIEGTRFECSFTWSDAEPFDEEERWRFGRTYTSVWARLGEDYDGKKPTVVYVPKNDGDFGGDGPYFEMLRNFVESKQESGISVQASGDGESSDIKKMIARVSMICEMKRKSKVYCL